MEIVGGATLYTRPGVSLARPKEKMLCILGKAQEQHMNVGLSMTGIGRAGKKRAICGDTKKMSMEKREKQWLSP